MNLRVFRHAILLLGVAGVFSGCGGGSTPIAAPRPTNSPAASSAPSATPSSAPSATASPSPSPTRTASPTPTPSPAPSTAAKVYVVNDGGGPSITVYAANPTGTVNEAPLGTISGNTTGLNAPAGAAVDASGKIYVVQSTNFPYSVAVYAANPSGTLNEAPAGTISGSSTGLNGPAAVAVDASGKIYVANANGGSVTVYAANPSGALNEAPLATIAGSNTGMNSPTHVALDTSGKIYVVNQTAPSITVYAANPSGALDEAPLATIAGSNTGLGVPQSVAVDASGKIYVANYANGSYSILVYAANPSGTLNEAPLATIAGSNTGLSGTVGVALDASGKVYALNEGSGVSGQNGSVTVYAANPSGTLNEAPLGTIAGSTTGLFDAVGIAVH